MEEEEGARAAAQAAPEPPTDPAQPVAPADRPGDQLASLSGQLLDGRYRVGRRLGEGGMAYVYRAEELDTGRAVAVKILIPRLSRDPASVERLRREATIAMRLDHPNVCPILRLGRDSGPAALSGDALSRRRAAERARIPPRAVLGRGGLPLLIQMCHGLQHAHELQIIHRDLKPENMMLVPEEAAFRSVVMDFGLAKERRTGAEMSKLTATGIVLGTPEFMSPEQIRGKPLDGRSDIYALGVLAFELFTGHLPFPGKSAQETMIARLRGTPQSLRDARPELPAKLDAIITKCLAMDVANRYASMSELAQAFEGVVGTSSVLGRLFRR